MANEKETENEKVSLQTRVDPSLYNAILRIATADERSMSNATERLLKTHPIVQPLLETESVATA